MGAFSRLRIVSPVTGKPIILQFKHGLDRQTDYVIGDSIEPFREDSPAKERIFAGGIEPPCSAQEPDYFRIVVLGGRIVSADPISEPEHDRIEGLF